MNWAILASTVIGAIAILVITSTIPANAVDPCANPSIWVSDEGNGKAMLYLTQDDWDNMQNAVEINLKPNKHTGWVISGDLGRDYDNDVIKGSSMADKISAGNGDDIVCAGSGDDQISGGKGNDTIYGDGGVDTIRGGSGNDTLYAGEDSDADYVDGGRGDDTIYATSGTDSWNGGRGTDTCPDGEDYLVSCEQ